ncbi:MAG TPA: hypothetical protein VNB49_17380 [Candidatus Dormibacteraeota bacterium]|nr:hypothetical protein [Candidatus Dormibacteraeota bacterium]
MRILQTTSISILAGLFLAGICSAQEKKIKRSDLPPAVEKTVADVSKGATIKGYSEETENGKTPYEVEMVVKGHTKDVELDPSGGIVEIEEEAAMDSLPANVKAGLAAKAAGAKILKVETLTKGGKLVAYEAKVQSAAGKKSEIQVGPDGKPLDHEE